MPGQMNNRQNIPQGNLPSNVPGMPLASLKTTQRLVRPGSPQQALNTTQRNALPRSMRPGTKSLNTTQRHPLPRPAGQNPAQQIQGVSQHGPLPRPLTSAQTQSATSGTTEGTRQKTVPLAATKKENETPSQKT